MDNLKDATLEQLADHGDGNYGYVDTPAEARRLLVDRVDATLVAIAHDVKVQVEFNPAAVEAWRLIGYENRALAAADFADDATDAGEVGVGHAVTALYEIVPAGVVTALGTAALTAELPMRYQTPGGIGDAVASGEILQLALRYKLPGESESTLVTYTLADGGHILDQAPPDVGFAAAVAAFGMLLRDSPHRGVASWDMVLDLARPRIGDDPSGERAEFVHLVERARDLAVTGDGVPRTEGPGGDD